MEKLFQGGENPKSQRNPRSRSISLQAQGLRDGSGQPDKSSTSPKKLRILLYFPPEPFRNGVGGARSALEWNSMEFPEHGKTQHEALNERFPFPIWESSGMSRERRNRGLKGDFPPEPPAKNAGGTEDPRPFPDSRRIPDGFPLCRSPGR